MAVVDIEPVAPCPVCTGSGTDLDMKTKTFEVCRRCLGRGYVPLVKCLGCGRPAFVFWPAGQLPIIRFCGSNECLAHLIEVRQPNMGVQTGFIQRALSLIKPTAGLVALKEEILARYKANKRHGDDTALLPFGYCC